MATCSTSTSRWSLSAPCATRSGSAAAGLAADARGVVCDASCRVFSAEGVVLDDVFVAGDVARWPHPLFEGQLIAVEHWDNAVKQAAVAAHNMVRPAVSSGAPTRRCPPSGRTSSGSTSSPSGCRPIADELVVTQGSPPELRFVAVYGGAGRIVAAVAVNAPLWLDYYQGLIAARAPFPPPFDAVNAPAEPIIRPAGFPPRGHATHSPTALATGPGPSSPAPPLEPPPAPARRAHCRGAAGPARATATASALRRDRRRSHPERHRGGHSWRT